MSAGREHPEVQLVAGRTEDLEWQAFDEHGAPLVIVPDDLVRYKDVVVEDEVCFVAASVERTREEPGLVVTRVVSRDQAKRERTTGLVIELPLDSPPDRMDAVAGVLPRYRGSCPVFVHIRDGKGNLAKLKASSEFGINPVKLVLAEVQALVGPHGLVYFSRQANGRNGR